MKRIVFAAFIILAAVACKKKDEAAGLKGVKGSEFSSAETTITVAGYPFTKVTQDLPAGFYYWGDDIHEEDKVKIDAVWKETYYCFTAEVVDLTPGTVYYFEPWYKDGDTIYLGEVFTVSTWEVPHEVEVAQDSELPGPHSVRISGRGYLKLLKGAEFGFVISRSFSFVEGQYTFYPVLAGEMDKDGNFSKTVDGLNGNYYYSAAHIGPGGKIQVYGVYSGFTTRAIDLGLSVEWSKCNLDGYYAWGEMSPREGKFTLDNYTFKDKVTTDLTSAGHDVARQELGEGWSIPSWNDFMELMNNCKIYQESSDLQHGKYFYSKKEGYEGINIFLPADRYCDDYGLVSTEDIGYYWTSTPYDDNSSACFMFTATKTNSGSTTQIRRSRYFGMSIRPVYKK